MIEVIREGIHQYMVSKSDVYLENASDLIHIGDTITDKFSISYPNSYSVNSIHDFVSQHQILQLYNNPCLLRINRKPYQETNIIFDLVIQLSDNSTHTFKNQSLKIR